MANPYEQFGMVGGDGGTAPAAAPAGGSYSGADLAADMPNLLAGRGSTSASANPYAQFGMIGEDNSASPGGPDIEDRTSNASMSGIAKQAALGLVSGIPNAAAGLSDLLEKGTVDALTFSNPVTGENQFTGLGHALGLTNSPEPKPEPYIPTTGQDIRNLTHVEGLPQPQNPQERIARMGGEGAVLMLAPEAAMGRLGSIGNAARAATVGLTSGAGGQAAAEAVPEKYKPLASLIGGLGGGLAGEAVSAVPGVIGSGARAATDYVAPLTTSGQERLAGQTLRGAATNPDEAIAALDTAPKTIVPGSSPTTFQLTGDTGLGNLERSVATQSPEAFIARRAEQNAARLDALNDIQAEGHPEAVSGFFRSQLDDLDKTTQALHDTAAENARGATSGLGGGDAAALGEQARTALQNRLDDVRAQERTLWNAVDPENNLQTVSSPIKQAVSRIYGDMGPETKLGMAPIESQIANVVSQYGQTLPFQRLIDLRSAVSQAMRDVRSPLSPNQPAYARLTQLRGAIEDSISDSVAQKAAQEQQAVATGAMQPQDSLMARFAAERQKWYDDRAVEGSRASSGNNAGRGPTSFSRASGAEGQAGGGPGGNQGGENLSGQPLLDEEAAGRLKAATAATAERKQTFGAKPVSQILQRPGSTQPFTMPSAGVTSSIWKAGNAGGDSVRSTLKAVNKSADAVSAVQNMAAQSLRDKAADGVITPKILDAWKKQHSSALTALEEASPGTMAKFENAAKAGDYLERVAADRKDALDAYQKSAAGKVLKVEDPADVVKTIGSVFDRKDSVAQMKNLVKEASKDPDAMTGLRKAVVEYMQNKLVSNTEAGTSGRNLIKSDAFQTFLGKNYTALRQLFGDEELGTMRAIAQDLKRANRSISSSKLPGQSNTAQDLSAVTAHNLKESLLTKIITHAIGGGAGFLGGGLYGTAAGIVGTHLLAGMREAGIRNIEDLVRNAMLDPELAKTLMMKAPRRIDTGSELSAAARLRRLSALSATQSSEQPKH